ncbi:fumarate hydratase C-terminal domain-containing protein [Mariluticola halotolerans]|uniref:fumarate hydratase C-terminal domain-containing protein n=1 Tax=Mariluticola halotolerans TaxID=2909283 RepID=UPI0026E13248|nr:fumarate hydratase C-terminal domain-containing protein [Mariluticola halotolerans]UJQ94720.1 fumarate hydratase C-terminal domain-containing protein [Mariluticola halotolerans]
MNSAETEPLRLTLPLSVDVARSLKVGDMVLLDGEVTVTAGFVTHERMIAALAKGEPLPIDLRGQAFFHMGSNCREENGKWLPNYVNPTTSTRFNAFMPTLIRELGLTSVGGKGGMGAECVAALKEMGCVYFSMPGGASPLLSNGAEERLETGWDDLIEQFRLSRYRLNGFGPVTVAIDAHGNSLYEDLQQAAVSRLPDILKELEATRLASSTNSTR